MTTTNQLELGFNGMQTRIFGRRREQRVARAKWWFTKMHEAVKNAWQEQAQPPAEQFFFAGVNRSLKV